MSANQARENITRRPTPTPPPAPNSCAYGFAVMAFRHFKNLLISALIKFLFIFSVVIAVLFGVFVMFTQSLFQGLLILIVGTFISRLYCEMIFIVFGFAKPSLTLIEN